jgi:hypothetical protein
MVIYDVLYAWCGDARAEVHNWTPPKAEAAPEGVP